MIQPFDKEEWVRISNCLHSATFGTTFLTVRLGHKWDWLVICAISKSHDYAYLIGLTLNLQFLYIENY